MSDEDDDNDEAEVLIAESEPLLEGQTAALSDGSDSSAADTNGDEQND